MQLVATHGKGVVGIMEIDIADDPAAIDTVAVHPDHQGRGIASALLAHARAELSGSVATLDAWTREDEPALEWYRAKGFVESEHYLHVYKSWSGPGEEWTSPAQLSAPVTAFCHAAIDDETEIRARFARVYVCRRFSQPVIPG